VATNIGQDLAHLARIKECSRARALVDGLLFENGFQAVLLYRVGYWFRSRRIPILGPLITRIAVFLTGAEISPQADIGPGLYVSHGQALVIGGGARIGRNAFLLHQVTIGSPSRARLAEMPVIGDDVFIGAGAKLIGAIHIGDRCFIGANVVLTRDVPADSRVVASAEPVVSSRLRDGAESESASSGDES